MDEAVQVISELIGSREKGRVAGLQRCDDLDASSCRHLALAVQRDRLIGRAFDIGSWDLNRACILEPIQQGSIGIRPKPRGGPFGEILLAVSVEELRCLFATNGYAPGAKPDRRRKKGFLVSAGKRADPVTWQRCKGAEIDGSAEEFGRVGDGLGDRHAAHAVPDRDDGFAGRTRGSSHGSRIVCQTDAPGG